MKSLSLVIPVYNAEGLLKRILAHVPLLVENAAEVGFALQEVIVVDDGGRQPIDMVNFDLEPLNGLPVRLLRNERNRGKGYSVRKGVLAATALRAVHSKVQDQSSPYR